jgi:hypothetical protein
LETYDLLGFEVRAAPKTAGLRDQQEHTRPGWQHVILAMAENGVAPDHDGWKASGPDWVSTSGILEAAGEDAENNKALQMVVKKFLTPLIAIERNTQGEDKQAFRVISRDCICEEGRAPIPIRANTDYHEHKIHAVQRRMFKLRPLAVVRQLLQASGLSGDWDENTIEWKARGDRGWQVAGGRSPADATSGKPPF